MSTPSRWVNTEPDAGAPHALLERLAARVEPTVIDEIWIFPTRRIAIGESTVFVVAAREDDPERRRVITARYAVSRNNKGIATVQEKIDEHGTAPAGAVARIVQGVLRRMGEEGEQPPRVERIEFEQDRWWTLFEELGGKRPDPAAATPPDASSAAPDADTPAAVDVAEAGANADAAADEHAAAPAPDDAGSAPAESPAAGADVPIDGEGGSSYQ